MYLSEMAEASLLLAQRLRHDTSLMDMWYNERTVSVCHIQVLFVPSVDIWRTRPS
jgi:hypothetical protein